MKPSRKNIATPPKYRWRIVATGFLSCFLVMGVVAVSEVQAQEKPAEYTLDTYKIEELSAPIPTKIVVPRISSSLVGKGTQVCMLFNITESGKPLRIKDNAGPFKDAESQLAAAMRYVLRYWEFTPAKDPNGNAVAVKAALPVKIVGKGEGNADEYVQVSISTPVIVAFLAK